jgi:hypothetical protein
VVEVVYGTQCRSGSFSLFYVGSVSQCLRSFSFSFSISFLFLKHEL